MYSQHGPCSCTAAKSDPSTHECMNTQAHTQAYAPLRGAKDSLQTAKRLGAVEKAGMMNSRRACSRTTPRARVRGETRPVTARRRQCVCGTDDKHPVGTLKRCRGAGGAGSHLRSLPLGNAETRINCSSEMHREGAKGLSVLDCVLERWVVSVSLDSVQQRQVLE